MRLAQTILLALTFYLGGCTSPEAARARGGGPGADVGNRIADVEMHAGSEMFWETPRIITSKHPSLETAQHARQVSRK